jgi:hypothetical protein
MESDCEIHSLAQPRAEVNITYEVHHTFQLIQLVFQLKW